MPTEITISSLDDLEPSLLHVLKNIDDPIAFAVPGGKLEVVIKLKGDSWDGMVDIRVAKFVCELQSSIDRLRKHCDLNNTEKQLVKIQVKNGSTELHADLLQYLTNLASRMTPGQTLTLALATLGCGLVGWSLTKILSHLEKTQKERLDAGKSTEVIETLRQAIIQIDPERAPRKLVASMLENDTIQTPVDSAPLARELAKDRYPRKRRVTPLDTKIDDNYLISTILLETPPRLTLSRGDLEFKADLSMHIPATDKDAFLSKIRMALDAGTPIRAALHVDARVGDKIHSATIVGIGNPPREGAVCIEDALD